MVDAADRHVALGLGVAVPDHQVPDDVRAVVLAVTMHHRRPVGVERRLLGGTLHVDHGLEQLVLRPHRRGRAARLLGLLGRDESDRLAVVAHPIGCQHGLVGELQAVRLLARHVSVSEDGVYAGHRERLEDVEGDDLGVGVRAAHGDAPEHSGRTQVARVLELARHLRRRVVPRPGVADSGPPEQGLLLCGRTHARAASRTASKILA